MTVTYNKDWDVEQYNDETEPEHHWQLRRAFMLAHQDKFPEDYLVSLARAFTNMEFMGCSYPPAVMKRVNELSKEVAQKYREEKKTKLQRTFVSANNAAEDKVNRTKRRNT